jgi:hypothetical protein
MEGNWLYLQPSVSRQVSFNLVRPNRNNSLAGCLLAVSRGYD